MHPRTLRRCLFGAGATALGLATACGSKESGQAVTTSTASGEPAAAASASATATSSGAASAALPGLEKREMLAFDLGTILGELPERKDPMDDLRPKPQKIFRQLSGGKGGYCGITSRGGVDCWGKTPVNGITGLNTQVALGDAFLCGVDLAGDFGCAPGDVVQGLPPASGSATPAAGQPSSAPSAAAGQASSASSGAAGQASSAPSASATAGASAAPSGSAAAGGSVKIRAVFAGPDRVCALDKQGHAACYSAEGACAIPEIPATGSFRSLAVGKCHVCARDWSEGVQCFAPEGAAVGKAPAGLVAKELVAGDGWSCAVDAKSALVCWGSAPQAPADLPAEIVSIGGRGGALCAIAKGGALRCWGSLTVNKPGPYTAVTVAAESACAQAAKDKLECFGSEAGNQLDVPWDTSMYNDLESGRTPEEVADHKKKRADALRDLLAKLPSRGLPVKVDRATKVPVGRVLEERFLPLVERTSFYRFFEANGYHDGFAIEAPKTRFKLAVIHERAAAKLFAFSEDGKRTSNVVVGQYELTDPDQTLYDCADVIEENATEAVLGEDLVLTVTKTTTRESLGRLRRADNGQISNACTQYSVTKEYKMSPAGIYEVVKTSSPPTFQKIQDEGCKGRWIRDPRGDRTTPRDAMPQECRARLRR